MSRMHDPFALPQHGGDLAAAEARFGRPADGWLDLSTGINPHAYPLPAIDPDLWRRLPSAQDERALLEAAAAAYGVKDPDGIVLAPGSQGIIQILPRIRPFSRVAVIGPTYGEHLNCWSHAGHQVLPCETLDRIGDSEVVVLGNPNNPDGRRHDPDRLRTLALTLAGRGGLLVVDEAFADSMPELSLAAHAGPGLLVLRSFGKFFGLAGARIGFAIADPPLARLLKTVLGPWPVNGPAMALAGLALADGAWIAATRERLSAEASALDILLTKAGLSVTGGTHLFRLINAPRAWALYEYLGHQGILVRPFAAAPRWLRFGLPPETKAAERLVKALAGWGK